MIIMIARATRYYHSQLHPPHSFSFATNLWYYKILFPLYSYYALDDTVNNFIDFYRRKAQ